MFNGCSVARLYQAALIGLVLFAANTGVANGGWVIERKQPEESPLLKEQEALSLSSQQQAEQRLRQAYRQALAEEKKKIVRKWPNSEVSGKSRWVVYSSDYEIKKVVDFEFNRVEIGLAGIYQGQRLDFQAMRQKVQRELEATIATSLEQAVTNDPVQRQMNKALGKDFESLQVPNRLVMSLLFDTPDPSDEAIREMAKTMMINASIRYQAMVSASVPIVTGKKLTYVVPIPDSRIRRKVFEYAAMVAESAQRFDLSEDLILAIIHTESHFNPLARSHIPAYGLMQIVPATAGRDAARKLYRKPKLLSAKFLYNPERNIEVGSAYLNMLYFDYLSAIEAPESRLYYTIAAYNAGASNVAKAFTGKASFQGAIATINSLSPSQVLTQLREHSPSLETRQYVEAVLQRRAIYARN